MGMLIVGVLLTACAEEHAPPPDNAVEAGLPDVKGFTGAHTRIVWVQDMGDGEDFYGQGDHLRLMGFDSQDGQGERPILPDIGHYAKPVISPKGDQVLFSDRNTGKIFIVNWDGSNLREIGQGRTLTTWMDRSSDREWVYAGRNQGQKEREHGLVVRFSLDDPEHAETVWDSTYVNENNFLLSADGTHASVNTPHGMGIADLSTGQWEKYGEGCWTNLAPDNSYLLWIFEGSHRKASIFEPQTHERRSVAVNGAPGIDGHRVFHPRWSNHRQFFAVTGPFREGIRGGGQDVEIYLGRFNADITEVEDWLRITHNDHADFYPDVWIAPDLAEASTSSQQKTLQASNDSARGRRSSWPENQQGLLFLWDNRGAQNEVVSDKSGKSRFFTLEAKGLARYGRFLEMIPQGGYFALEQTVAQDVLTDLAKASSWSLEALITPDTSQLNQFGIIAALVNAQTDHLISLVQDGSDLVLHLHGPDAQDDREGKAFALGQMQPGQALHVLVSFGKDAVSAYLNGVSAEKTQVTTNLRKTQDNGVFFGNTPSTRMPWQGGLESVAIYSREVGAAEALRNYTSLQSKLAHRQKAPEVVVQARLTESTPLPSVERIAPYRRALATNIYVIENVLQGEMPEISPGNSILAAHWVIMDEQILPGASRSEGQAFTMRLQRMEDRPELEGEWLGMDVSDVLLPLFYDVES